MATPFVAPSLASSVLTREDSKLPELNPRLLPTSCKAIDKALDGGFSYGLVSSISGADSSSKTLVRAFSVFEADVHS